MGRTTQSKRGSHALPDFQAPTWDVEKVAIISELHCQHCRAIFHEAARVGWSILKHSSSAKRAQRPKTGAALTGLEMPQECIEIVMYTVYHGLLYVSSLLFSSLPFPSLPSPLPLPLPLPLSLSLVVGTS